MNEEEIKQTIFQLLKRIAPDKPSQIKSDENIRETLTIDSFDTLQFIVALNDWLAIDIPEQEYGKITTLKSLVPYILDKKK